MRAIAAATTEALALVLVLVAGGACRSFHVNDGDGDAGALGDAAAPADGATGGRRFCETQPPSVTFCDDFDVGDLGATWSAVNRRGSIGTIDLDTAASFSPPRSLAAAKPASDGTTKVESWLAKQLSTTAQGVVVGAEVRVDAVGGGFNFLVVHQGNTDFVLAVYDAHKNVLRQEVSLADGGGALAEDAFKIAVSDGAWHRVEVTLSFDARTVVVTVDGGEALSVPFHASVVTSGDPLLVGVGLEFADGADPVGVHVDDVTVAPR